jgi:hypothetical protein
MENFRNAIVNQSAAHTTGINTARSPQTLEIKCRIGISCYLLHSILEGCQIKVS